MKKIHLLFTAFIACIFLFTGCKKEEFTVTFSPNGGKGAFVTQSFTQNVAQPLMANSFTNRGYNFTGWNTQVDGSGTIYQDQEVVKISGHLILYAQWAPATGNFTVTFNPNGATAGEMKPQTFEAGEPQALSPNAFYFENYWFSGWNTSPNGKGKNFENEQIISITADITLYAQWEPTCNTYFVMFDANGGEGVMEPQEIKECAYYKLNPNTFTNGDYLFKGWSVRADGTGYSFKDEASIRISANIILYAQWVNPDGGGEPCPGAPTVNDIDGNTYKTVQIGSQCWIRENLKTTKYNTGANIPIIIDDDWFYVTTGAMCYYNNDEANSAKFGALYNGYAVATNNLCPDGWRVPSNEEWTTLANELGGANNAGYKMKTVFDWEDYYGYDGGGSNESGFSALPAGYKQYGFGSLGSATYFWSSKIESYDYQLVRYLYYSSNSLHNDYYNQVYGLSVRCLKDN